MRSVTYDLDMPGLAGRSLLFLHNPKAAGSSFRDLLGRRFLPDASLAIGLDNPRGVRHALQEADQYRFVHGHVPHEAISYFKTRPFVFTVIREPVDRALSAFEFMKQQSSSMQLRAAAGQISRERADDYAKAADLTLAAFMRQEPQAAARHLGNLQVELLTCSDLDKRHRYDERFHLNVSHRELELAKERLASLDAFGVFERLPESTEYLAYALRTRPFGELPWCNKARSRPALEDIDPDTSRLLRAATSYDRELHGFASGLFERRRIAMLSELLTLNNRTADAVKSDPEREQASAAFTCGMQLAGEGWYAAESDGTRWFQWTGAAAESWIDLASPTGGRDAELQVGVIHAVNPEALFELEVKINDVRLNPEIRPNSLGHEIVAPVPGYVLNSDGGSNRVVLRSPRLWRPRELDLNNHDSRTLGIAVHRIVLTGANS